VEGFETTQKAESKLVNQQSSTKTTVIDQLQTLKHSVSILANFIPTLIKHLQHKCNRFEAGGISKHVKEWAQVTSDKNLLDIVRGMRIPLTMTPTQTMGSAGSFSKKEEQAIASELHRLLEKHIVEPAEHSQGEIISLIFVREKTDGQYRLILNLKQFNVTVEYEHFKMDTIKTITQLMVKDCYMASIDLKDAYYCIAVYWADRKYLRFTWGNTLYQFTCLPNGLACCPRLFTKLLKAPLSALHKLGHISSSYIDDIYLQGNTHKACSENVIDTVTQFDALGFICHPDKCAFHPSQQLTMLGFLLNSHTMTIQLPRSKAEDIKETCERLLLLSTCSIQQVASAIGKLVASFPGVMFGPLYYRNLDRDKQLALQASAGRYKAKLELQWWAKNVLDSYNVISHGHYDSVLTTDASRTGWGTVFNGSSTGGMWSADELEYHINALELLAVYLGLQTYLHSAEHTHIRIMSDNTTAVATLNNMGTSHSTSCNQLGKQIWEWCNNRSIWISAAHIPGKLKP
jgi:hypothetical protein